MIACPECGGVKSKVIDTRDTVDGGRRRRLVCACGTRFTTAELVLEDGFRKRTETVSKSIVRQITAEHVLESYTVDDLLAEVARRFHQSK